MASERGSGCGWLIASMMIIIAALVFFTKPNKSRDSKDEFASSAPAVARASSPANDAARTAAIAKFSGMPAIREAAWVRADEFVLLAEDNGKSWEPVADAACVWIRRQGYAGSFSVNIIEAHAALNKRTKQLAHARCG